MKSTLLIIIVVTSIGITGVGLLITIDHFQNPRYPSPGVGDLIDEMKAEPIRMAVCRGGCPELTDEDIHELIEIVFGDARKSWTNYPGGAGPTPPQNSTLTINRIEGVPHFGIAPLDFEAMLDDKIFVDKCKSNGGLWHHHFHDCISITEICEDVGGVLRSINVTNGACVGHCNSKERLSCVFPYEN